MYLKEIPVYKIVIGAIFCGLAAFSVLFSNLFFSAIFLVIGLNLLSTEGSEIDIENNSYRSIKSLFGIHFGKWQTCPEFEYVSVFGMKENQTVRVVTAQATVQSKVIFINLFYAGNRHITVYKTQDKEDAFNVAKKFSSIFNIDILDATEHEKKWL